MKRLSLLPLLSACVLQGCVGHDTRILESLESPDESLVATLVVSRPKLPSADATHQVFVSRKGRTFSDGARVLAGHLKGVEFEWIGRTELLVHLDEAHIFEFTNFFGYKGPRVTEETEIRLVYDMGKRLL